MSDQSLNFRCWKASRVLARPEREEDVGDDRPQGEQAHPEQEDLDKSKAQDLHYRVKSLIDECDVLM